MAGKPWTTTELRELQEIYQTKPIEAIAEIFGRSITAIRAAAKRAGFCKHRRDWKKICAAHKPEIALGSRIIVP